MQDFMYIKSLEKPLKKRWLTAECFSLTALMTSLAFERPFTTAAESSEFTEALSDDQENMRVTAALVTSLLKPWMS
jgi:hypothetical protein